MKKWLFLALFYISHLAAHPAQVLIIRHGEKDFEGNLNQRGLERAEALSIYFENQLDLLIYGPPVALFAARPTLNTFPYGHDENTARCLQTVAPTAHLLKLPIHAGYAKFQEDKLAEFIMHHAPYKGKNILICWHHETIDRLAAAFGIDPPPSPYPNDQFDETWVITFIPSPSLQIYHQRLMFGDLNIFP